MHNARGFDKLVLFSMHKGNGGVTKVDLRGRRLYIEGKKMAALGQGVVRPRGRSGSRTDFPPPRGALVITT